MGKKRTVDDPFEDFYELDERYWDSKAAVEEACYDVYPKWCIQKAGEPDRQRSKFGRNFVIRPRNKIFPIRSGEKGKTRKST